MSNLVKALEISWFHSNKKLFSPFVFKRYLLYGLLFVFSSLQIQGFQNLLISFSAENFLTSASVLAFLAIAFIYFSPQACFMMMDSLLRKRIDLKSSWLKFYKKSHSYFIWIITTAFFASVVIYAAHSIYTYFTRYYNHLSDEYRALITLTMLIIGLPAVLLLITAFSIYYVFITDFVTASMIKTDNNDSIFKAAVKIIPVLKSKWMDILSFWTVIQLINFITFIIGWFMELAVILPFSILLMVITQIASKELPSVCLAVISPVTLLSACTLIVLFKSVIYPFFGVFKTNFSLAYAGILIPELETISIERDIDGKIINSSTIYGYNAENNGEYLRPAINYTKDND